MYNFNNEILINPTEIELLVTKGMVDDPIIVEEPIIIPSVTKLNMLLDDVVMWIDDGPDTIISYLKNGGDGFLITYNAIDVYLTDSISDDIDISYSGDLRSVLEGYKEIAEMNFKNIDTIRRFSNDIDKILESIDDTVNLYMAECIKINMGIIRRLQSDIEKATAVTEFILNSCELGIRTVMAKMQHK